MITYLKDYQEKLLYSLTFVGCSFTYFYGGFHLIKGNYFIGTVEIFLSTLALVNLVLYRFHRNFEFAGSVILFLMVLILDFLVVTGGLERTGILWIYTFPLLAFFLKEIKKAVIWNIIFALSVVALTFLDWKGILRISYNFVEIRQALSSYTAVFLISFFYSYILKKLNTNLWEASIYDPLTNLYNRKYIYQSLEMELERLKRNLEESICVVYVDVDNFKRVNDISGHQEGDKVLKELADIFKKSFRKIDLIGRVGGDEFLFILVNCKDGRVNERFERLKSLIEKKFKKYNLSISYGIVKIPEDTVDLNTALRLADQRMYEMKNKHKQILRIVSKN
ncbi:diguanylate cyclase (GGDEF) domain-containing protein [Persephonella hydrogeniphila]|uniref:diguanylate cyclase n=1 Tax=Persephonella hydrogeniphila TaxID=198703 RepID=A0A285NM21_9AQUI|nr:GGDEF domain-containing protein [Persephonella hydrogeniphila]SNZ10007.1 diguanylate cyclase (GGDEF) domain-containing protein [Persephonella hydrogeniphila]